MSHSNSTIKIGILLCSLCIMTFGCAEPERIKNARLEKERLEKEAAAEKSPSGIINKTTQDVGEYDPDGDAAIADLQVKASANPLAAASGAYGYSVAEISKQAITRALQLFEATNERYPKDHEEFMEEILKKNNIHLPVLPGKRRYQYDVQNH